VEVECGGCSESEMVTGSGALEGVEELGSVVGEAAVYPHLVEFLHFDIQSTGQKSHCVSIRGDHRNALF